MRARMPDKALLAALNDCLRTFPWRCRLGGLLGQDISDKSVKYSVTNNDHQPNPGLCMQGRL